jgi:hypothetical protein
MDLLFVVAALTIGLCSSTVWRAIIYSLILSICVSIAKAIVFHGILPYAEFFPAAASPAVLFWALDTALYVAFAVGFGALGWGIKRLFRRKRALSEQAR